MTDPRTTRTNAADSAPGVDDGRKSAPIPGASSRPGGRHAVRWIVGAALLVLALVFISRQGDVRSDGAGAASSTREELQVSRDPDGRDAGRPSTVP